MMYLTFVGNVKQLLAESDQQNLRNDDPCKKNAEQESHTTINYPENHMLDYYMKMINSGFTSTAAVSRFGISTIRRLNFDPRAESSLPE